MAAQDGIEPPIGALTGRCLSAWLLRINKTPNTMSGATARQEDITSFPCFEQYELAPGFQSLRKQI